MEGKARVVVGAAVNVFLTGGALVRLLVWAKKKEDRKVSITIVYQDGAPVWSLALVEDGELVFSGVDVTLESVMVQAVVKLGKEW